MAGSAGSIFVDLLLKDASFILGLDRSSRKTKSAASSIKADFSSIKGVIADVTAAISAGAIFNKFIRNTIDAQNEQAQLSAVLKSTGNAAGFTIAQLNKMADVMSADSIFSSGQINNAQTRLLSYTGVLGENVPRAMQIVIDQAARLNISLEQSAETVGRALERPSKAAAALSRQGFGSYFTKDVVEMLESLEQQGKIAEAQIKILEVLEEGYGGAGKAARETLGGALIDLNNTVNTLLTSKDGLPELTKAINLFSDTLKIAAREGGLYEASLNRIAIAYLELYKTYNQYAVTVASATNFFGLRDEDVKKYQENVDAATKAQEDLIKSFSAPKEGDNIDFSKPELPTNQNYRPEVDTAKIKKDLKELDSLYEKNRYLIKDLDKETIRYMDTEEELNRLFKAKKITVDEYYTALENLDEEYDALSDKTKKFGFDIEEFSKEASRNLQDSFADFFKSSDEGFDGLKESFADMIADMLANAAAANLAAALFGVEGKNGKTSGGLLDGLGDIFGGGSDPLGDWFDDWFGGFFADGGFLKPGEWGIAGENGPEPIFGGRTGTTVIPNSGNNGGNTYYIDAKGADPASVTRIEQALMALAGPGVIEQRVSNAQSRGSL